MHKARVRVYRGERGELRLKFSFNGQTVDNEMPRRGDQVLAIAPNLDAARKMEGWLDDMVQQACALDPALRGVRLCVK